MAWPGTLLLVSHDRRFLDNVITSTLVFEGDGRVGEYVGGYEDWKRQSVAAREAANALRSGREAAPASVRGSTAGGDAGEPNVGDASGRPPARRKPSFKERREFETLPARIEELEAEEARLSAAVSAADFYKKPSGDIHAALARLEAIPLELHAAYARWDELDALMS